MKQADFILMKHWLVVQQLAEQLLQHDMLISAEIRSIIASHLSSYEGLSIRFHQKTSG